MTLVKWSGRSGRYGRLLVESAIPRVIRRNKTAFGSRGRASGLGSSRLLAVSMLILRRRRKS